jgi:hypothetical protein
MTDSRHPTPSLSPSSGEQGGETNGFSPLHPHQMDGRNVEPVYNHEGRCLVCGCEWRDEAIARYVRHIEDDLRPALRLVDPGSPLLPENWETDEGWEREAMHHA